MERAIESTTLLDEFREGMHRVLLLDLDVFSRLASSRKHLTQYSICNGVVLLGQEILILSEPRFDDAHR
jgi:hypothetical protein